MANGQLQGVIQHLRLRLAAHGSDGVPDAQLLERFTGQQDEAAFELLVWRHGKMVLGTCRRLLRDAHEAEDAFQACFLALARRAGSIGRRESVGGWLYKVAYRLALGAKARRTKRDAREQSRGDLAAVAGAPDPAAEAARREIGRVLDDEVNRLPDRYRVPFVLCHFEGRSNAEVARELGCPLGTVESRLTRARQRLRTGLSRRGVTLSAGLLATLAGQDAALASVPAALAAFTAKAATLVAAGQVEAARMVSTNVAALTEGVLRAMFITKLKTAAAVLLAVALAGTGAGVLTYRSAAGQPGPSSGARPDEAPPAPDAARIAELIGQLGSDTFADREKATKELEAIGAPALDALRKAARDDEPERRKRAEGLVKKIEGRVEAAKLLAPRRVRLSYKDTPLAEAVADFKKQSGYDLTLSDPEGKLKDRTITLDTGDVTFWQAFDLFCRKAGLVEAGPANETRPAGGGGFGGGARRGMGGGGGGGGAGGAGGGIGGGPGGAGGGFGGGRGGAGGLPGGPLQGGVFGRGGGVGTRFRLSAEPGRIVLADGKPQALPIDDAAAVRVRALDKSDALGTPAEGEFLLGLEATPEPKLRWQKAVAVRVGKVTDDQGQSLTQVLPAPVAPGAPVPFGGGRAGAGGFPGGRAQGGGAAVFGGAGPDPGLLLPLRLKKGTEEAKSLREISGTITAEVLTEPQPVMTVTDLLKSAGKTVKATEGGSVKIVAIDKQATGSFRVRCELDLPVGAVAPDSPYYELSVVDDKGNVLPPVSVSFNTIANGTELDLTFQPRKDQGEPAKLVCAVGKGITLDVPFTLKNVPLPPRRSER